MPYMLRQRITSVGSLSAIPTWRYKLPGVGKYTAFELVVDCNRHANRADSTVTYPLESQISKIELVEGGSRALISLSGAQIDAMNYWDLSQPNARRHNQNAAGDNLLHLYLMGGRGLYDRDYGYDMSRLGETYLEYSHDLSADAAEKFDVSAHTVYLYGWRWMGPGEPSFRGYFRTRQLAVWTTTGADVLKIVELPLANPYRRIGFQATTLATSIGGTAKRIELSANNGQFSPVTIQSMMHWCFQEVAEYHLHNHIEGTSFAPNTNDVVLPEWFSYGGSLQITQEGDADPGGLRSQPWTNPMTFKSMTASGNSASFVMTGYGFQKCLRLGFDHLEDGTDLFPTAGLGSLDLLVTENAAAKQAKVFVQDVLSY